MWKRALALCLTLLILVSPLGQAVQAAERDYTHHVEWMQAEGIVSGHPQGLEVDRPITRAEMVTLLYRLCDWELPTTPVAIHDVTASHWAYGVIQAALHAGVMTLENGRANPSQTISSLEAFALAKRAGITLNIGPAATISRGQIFHALGEAVTTTITVVHTNDTHGRVLSDERNGVLGWEKIATIIDANRRQNANTLVLDAGDTIHGTNEAQFFQGHSVVGMMNSAGADIMVPGNHDFNYGIDHLLKLNQEAAFYMVAANVWRDGELVFQPYVITEMAGLRVGVFGLATPETLYKTHPKNVAGVDFEDPVIAAQRMVAELGPQVDLLIALTHLGDYDDEAVALGVDGLHFIIGGHSHSEILEARQVNGTYIAQAGEHGKFVGVQDLTFYQGRLVHVLSRPVPYCEQIESSLRTGKLANEVRQRVQREMSIVIGEAEVELVGDREHVRTRETNLGNLIADIMREATGADIALTNGGGIRASIPAGPVTIDQIARVVPFDNTLYTLELTGAHILEALEFSVRLYPSQNGGFLQVSGISFVFDPDQPVGQRVIDVLVGDQALDPEATYVVATNDFLAAGGDGYVMFREGTGQVDTGLMLREMMINHLRATGDLNAAVEGRITTP